MENMLSYVRKNLNSFEVSPFNDLDSLVLAWFCYLHLPEHLFVNSDGSAREVHLSELMKAEYFEEMIVGVKSPDETIALLLMMCASPRFREMTVSYYEDLLDHGTSTQFAAMTFKIRPNLYYLAYRGTDDTFIGWKEDCDMALSAPVQSQALAGWYLKKIAGAVDGRLITGGHSKGGNLAVYAAATVDEDVRGRVEKIYSFDGPGFQEEDFKHAAFDEIRDRIIKIIPKSSMIGMIFTQECAYRVVKSSARGINQHNLFSWVIRDGRLQYVEDVDHESQIVYRSLNKWIASLEPEERKQFIDDIFEILEETGVDSFDELGAGIKNNIPIMAKKYMSMEKSKREFLKNTLRQLADYSAKMVPEVIKENKHKHHKE